MVAVTVAVTGLGHRQTIESRSSLINSYFNIR